MHRIVAKTKHEKKKEVTTICYDVLSLLLYGKCWDTCKMATNCKCRHLSCSFFQSRCARGISSEGLGFQKRHSEKILCLTLVCLVFFLPFFFLSLFQVVFIYLGECCQGHGTSDILSEAGWNRRFPCHVESCYVKLPVWIATVLLFAV